MLLQVLLLAVAATSPPAQRLIPPACFASSRFDCGYQQRALARFVKATASPEATIQYSWSKSGFVVLRKELSIERNGDYEAAYNGKRGCSEKGTLAPSASEALWKEADALTAGAGHGTEAPTTRASSKPRHTIMTRASMDNGPPIETLTIIRGDDSWTYRGSSSPAVRHLVDHVRQLLPPCAF